MLALTVDKLDGIPENARGAYVEKDGKFVLDVEVPDVAALNGELTDWKKKHTTLEKANKVISDTAADLQRKLEAKEAAHGQTDEKITGLLTKWEEDAKAREKAAEDRVRAELQPAVEKVTKYELDNALVAAFVKNGGRPEKANTMLKIAKGEWSLVDGKPVMKDAAGTISNKSLDEYFGKDYKSAEAEQYVGSKATGGNAPGGNGKPVISTGDINNPNALLSDAFSKGATE